MLTSINQTLTHYETTGSDPNTLLILHGWGHSAAQWEQFSLLLPPDLFTIISLDLPVFGQTQPLPGYPGVREYSDWLDAFITKKELKHIFLLGHSFGGQVATDYCLRYPGKIKHLILLSPAIIRAPNSTTKSKLVKIFKPFTFFLPQPIKRSLLRLFASSNYSSSNPAQKLVLNKIIRQDYSNQIKLLHTPTSIVWGSEDKEIPYMGKFLAENIPHSQLFVLYGSDHNPHLSSPFKLLSVITDIVQQNG